MKLGLRAEVERHAAVVADAARKVAVADTIEAVCSWMAANAGWTDWPHRIRRAFRDGEIAP